MQAGNPIVTVPDLPSPAAPAPNVTTHVTILAPEPDPELVKATGLDLATGVADAAGEGLAALGRAAFEAGGIWRCDPLVGVLELPQVAAMSTAMIAVALTSLAALVGWNAIRVTHEETTWGEVLPRLIGCAVVAAVIRPALGMAANVTVGLCHSIAGTDVSGQFGSGITIPGAITPLAGALVVILFNVALLFVALKAWSILALWALVAVLAPLAAVVYAIPQLEGVAARIGQLGLGSLLGLVGMVTVLTLAQPLSTTWGTAVPLGQVALRLALLWMAWSVPDLLMRLGNSGGGINLAIVAKLLRR